MKKKTMFPAQKLNFSEQRQQILNELTELENTSFKEIPVTKVVAKKQELLEKLKRINKSEQQAKKTEKDPDYQTCNLF